MLALSPWNRLSKKVQKSSAKPSSIGVFLESDAEERGLRFSSAHGGNVKDGFAYTLYFFVDEFDGIIADAKFQVYGPSLLIGLLDLTCQMLTGKSYGQALNISADLLDFYARDHKDKEAFPQGAAIYLNAIIDTVLEAFENCKDIPIPANLPSPIPGFEADKEVRVIEGFAQLPKEEKKQIIEETLKQEILPYIALDGGGVDVMDVKEDLNVIIMYQGNCTSCISAVGATLSAIQHVLRTKVCEEITVTPLM